ncbi:ATP-binding domain-containing protein [Methanogenium marinum]|uniref:ATP-binding domain-containing protein n=1 Tax=Methanogenium marinum TaxID=348610 RepID=A0A9Q4PUQ6_9EURY|nr:ATP-binding domain-containing protein [Methanogenium marinum]MDE4907165.1 ATP-binding domain-containing protein [Methanogenium marinum]
MIDLNVTLPTYATDEPAKRIWSWIEEKFPDTEGVCYYKHPVFTTESIISPEFTLITKKHNPIIICCFSWQLEDIESIDENFWKINGNEIDSPFYEAEDFAVTLQSKFDKHRILRYRLGTIHAIAFPLINKAQFEDKFPDKLNDEIIIWKDGNINPIISPLDLELKEEEWRTLKSIAQGIHPLTKGSGLIHKDADKLGDAIKYIDRYIALLDEEQAKAALQIAPGPQRIRGLAGTGKTVLLAMKAANIHLRYPEKKILFTFNTQSLYNQVRTLITKFYRFYSEIDPDWDNLHIRHAWGGYSRQGVYFDTCMRHGLTPIQLQEARILDRDHPFTACCKQLLNKNIEPYYDFIMVDEAQDFQSEYFQLLYKLSKSDHCIYWVYDELQSLSGEQIPSPKKLFGIDDDGNDLVSLEGEPYPGGIEKDFVLHRSYRCPHKILMLAHAIGLGLYSSDGPIQILSTKESWDSFGYIVKEGELVEGNEITIYRPPENSPTPITEIYNGSNPEILTMTFKGKDEELDWIASSIKHDIEVENVLPEHIVAICLDGIHMKHYLPPLQKKLIDLNIRSKIPGLGSDVSAFGEVDNVTLSTVFRAKGNESYIVYIFCFEALYDYVEELQNRNRAFTAISRSKAWVRITGVGQGMLDAEIEINKILNDQPEFKFKFPDLSSIRNLDAETTRRRREILKGTESLSDLVNLNPKVFGELIKKQPKLAEKLLSQISEARKE